MHLHRTIFQAIRSRDAEAARRLMWEHLYETSALVTQVVAGHTKPARALPKKSAQNKNGSKSHVGSVRPATRIK
jgi:hypothetical protein